MHRIVDWPAYESNRSAHGFAEKDEQSLQQKNSEQVIKQLSETNFELFRLVADALGRVTANCEDWGDSLDYNALAG